MKILYCASEAQPVAFSGGLADVAGSLPKAFNQLGEECAVVVPYYENTISEQYKANMTKIASFYVPVGWRKQYCGVLTQNINGVTYYFLDNQYYFKRDYGMYGYYDDAERFVFFSRAILEMLLHIDFKPDILHVNDWQTALVPVYYSLYYHYQYSLMGVKTVFSIHNIQYQGRYGMELLEEVVGIPYHLGSILEFDKDINFMKGAIETADKITTVSPTYAKEILDPWFSHGLDPILRQRQYKTTGFLNGIDTEMYNPKTDTSIPAQYSPSKKTGKKVCKQALLEECGLPAGEEPVIGIISRLVDHKGFDIVKHAFERILEMGYKLVILGSGEHEYEEFFRHMHYSHPDKVSFTCGYRPDFAKRIYAGADIFLMPSKSEPCGLAQMIAARYGTIPVVRSTGGLKDSIIDAGEPDGSGIGFTFLNYDSGDMLYALSRAREAYNNKKGWSSLVTKAMKADFSWENSAKLYLGLYRELVGDK